MKTLILISAMTILTSLHAYESDQHTVPDFELADVGVDISAFIYKQTATAVEKINRDLEVLPLKIEETKNKIDSNEALEKPMLMKALKKSLEADITRLKSIKTRNGVVAAVYDELGGTFTWEDQRDGVFGLPLSIIPYEKNIKDGQPITFVPKRRNNIYAYAGFHRLISPSYFVFCSSLKMFGVYLGVDKLGHMFNQGYEYYVQYHQGLSENKSSEDSLSAVVEWGESTERGTYGTLVDGVYSNGDLAANFSGFHFYENILNPVTIGDKVHPPILTIRDDFRVEFNSQHPIEDRQLLAPFISQHLNEAINPSHYEKLQRLVVIKAVKNRCEKVKRFYHLKNAEEIKTLTDSMTSWHGKNYGHRNYELLKIDELCF